MNIITLIFIAGAASYEHLKNKKGYLIKSNKIYAGAVEFERLIPLGG